MRQGCLYGGGVQRLMRLDANRGQFNAHICRVLSIRPSVRTRAAHMNRHLNTSEGGNANETDQ